MQKPPDSYCKPEHRPSRSIRTCCREDCYAHAKRDPVETQVLNLGAVCLHSPASASRITPTQELSTDWLRRKCSRTARTTETLLRRYYWYVLLRMCYAPVMRPRDDLGGQDVAHAPVSTGHQPTLPCLVKVKSSFESKHE